MSKLYQEIPNVNTLIDYILNEYELNNKTILKESVDQTLIELRRGIKNNEINSIDINDLCKTVKSKYDKATKLTHQNCINATGTIIHTNLGRSLLSAKMLDNVDVLKRYNNLEFNLETQKRGSRYDLVEQVICKVTGAQSALVVNNNAAAVMLILNEFAANKEVIVSNSELVEIGGSFRIPEIIKLSHAKMVNIGTTNKTHLKDYISALNIETGLIAKIHQSNFYIEGFVKSVSALELIEYRNEHNLDYIVYEDLASGALIDFSKYGMDKEPLVTDSIKDGVDIVSFSGDKLLGGVQAGIIIGKTEYIDRLKKNQLLRVIRPSGLILNIVENTFNLYLDQDQALNNIPTLTSLSEEISLVKTRAEYLYSKLNNNYDVKVIKTKALVGGGCMPKTRIDSYGVGLSNKNLNSLKDELAEYNIPIIVSINDDKIIFDVKTLSYEEMDIIALFLNNRII